MKLWYIYHILKICITLILNLSRINYLTAYVIIVSWIWKTNTFIWYNAGIWTLIWTIPVWNTLIATFSGPSSFTNTFPWLRMAIKTGAVYIDHTYPTAEGFHVPNNDFFRNLAWTLWVAIGFTTASIKYLGWFWLSWFHGVSPLEF